VVDDVAAIFADPDIELVYVASNHASHTDYAVAALLAGKDVVVEKPVAVSVGQLRRLVEARRQSGRRVFAGYNRPFSAAVADLKASVGTPSGPLTLSCFVSGHVLPESHWYRRPGEGTRICGNVGHWLDLAVHLLGWRGLPDRWRIVIGWSNPEQRDDDVAITLMSEAGDLVNIVLTARTEPFEGINESINVQWGDTIGKIDDFRHQTLWRGSGLRQRRYWPKDVGHRRAILQPFATTTPRAWSEIEDSTLLMLHLMEMVQSATPMSTFSFAQARAWLTTTPPIGHEAMSP
jgi:predicted dehydrogenase